MGYAILNGLLFLTAALLIVLARLNPLFPGDLGLAHATQSISSGTLDQFMAGMSYLEAFPRSLLVTLALAVLLWIFRRRLEAVFVLLTIIHYPIGLLIRVMVSRPRPDPEMVRILEVTGGDASFPSGHAVFATVLLGFLFYLASAHLGRGVWRGLCQVILTATLLGIGLSRVYLGVHWPSDVLGGYLIGGLILSPLVALYRGFVAPRLGHYDMA